MAAEHWGPHGDCMLPVSVCVSELCSVLVHSSCSEGVYYCGLLITAMNALDKLKAEQQVDIYNPVLTAKLRRPEFIPTVVSCLSP